MSLTGNKKNLLDVRIALDRITTLVSLNNFGKSNVLMGIDFGLSFLRAANDDKKRMMADANVIPFNRSVQGRNFQFETEALTEGAGQEHRALYGNEFAWQRNGGKASPCRLGVFEGQAGGERKKRMLMILTKIILPAASDMSLIAIEEPENSVHPKFLSSYIRIMDQLLDDRKAILTGHSLHIVNCLEPSWILCGEERQAWDG